MARTNATNFTGALQFPYATAAADLFKKEDVQVLAQAVDQHTHDGTGKGLPVAPPAAGSIPGSAIADGSITSDKILDATITAIDIAPNAIVGGNIAPSTIVTANLADNSVTSAKIVDGTIATADVAINAIQNQVGQYVAIPTFSTTTTGAWLATPIAVSVATTGQLLRISGQTTFAHSTVGGRVLVAIAENAVNQNLVAMFDNAGVNYTTQIAWTIYVQPAAGTYTFAVYVQLVNAGTLSITGSVQSSLYVTEQLR